MFRGNGVICRTGEDCFFACHFRLVGASATVMGSEWGVTESLQRVSWGNRLLDKHIHAGGPRT